MLVFRLYSANAGDGGRETPLVHGRKTSGECGQRARCRFISSEMANDAGHVINMYSRIVKNVDKLSLWALWAMVLLQGGTECSLSE